MYGVEIMTRPVERVMDVSSEVKSQQRVEIGCEFCDKGVSEVQE